MSDSNRVKDASNRFYPVNLEVDGLKCSVLSYISWMERGKRQTIITGQCDGC